MALLCRNFYYLDWLALSFIESCLLTKILDLVMFSISISGSAECDVCAYEATDDFTIIFSIVSKLFKVYFLFFAKSLGAQKAFTEINFETEMEIHSY
jgi:hypothetical protein